MSATFMLRHAEDDFTALLIGQAAYSLGARVVSVCPYEMREPDLGGGHSFGKVIARYLLVWIELPDGITPDVVDEVIEAEQIARDEKARSTR